MTTFASNRGRIMRRPSGRPSSSGSASSEVDKKTASRVPRLMSPAAYRLEALAEKPHWGMQPSAAPTSGPAFPMPEMAFSIRADW